MMDESVQHRDYRVFLLEHRNNECRRAARPSETSFDRAAQQGLQSRALADLPLIGWMPHRAETRHIAPLASLRRIVAAVRVWRERARSRQQLCALDDRMLRDIGLTREDAGYELLKPFRHWD